MKINPFQRFLELLPQDPQQVGDVAATFSDGTAEVSLLAGSGSLRVRNPNAASSGQRVFVQGGAITGPAPTLPVVSLTI